MNPTPEHTALQELIQRLGLSMEATFIPRSKSQDPSREQINWDIRITRKGRVASLRTSYSAGIGHLPEALHAQGRGLTVDEHARISYALEHGKYDTTGTGFPRKPLPPPSLEDVLYCIVSDADVLEHADFESWAREFGYDTDSRSAERTYRQCMELGLALRRLVSDAELALLREAYQDY